MTRVARWQIVGWVGLLLAACNGDGEDEPLQPDSVLTYNIYLGADIIDPLMASSMGELAAAVQVALAQFEANDFNVRAEALADQIAAEQPALIGLQEVVTVYIQPNGDRQGGGDTPATEVVIDFEQVLMAELAERGLDYRVAVRGENTDIELPSANGSDLRLVDHDVILVRGDIVVGETDANQYEARLPIPLPDGDVDELVRGFVWAEVTLNGTPTLFVNTHLEVSAYEAVQVAQTAELLAWLATRSEPVILVGDFNSRADPEETTQTYDLIESAGYEDAWELRADPTESGNTCCQANDLRNPNSDLSQRIDFIWLLGVLPAGTPEVTLVGADPAEKTSNGLWASNHAGVAARFAQ